MRISIVKILRQVNEVIKLTILKVTPVSNVLIGKCCFKSDKAEKFISKVIKDGSKIDVYDVSDRKMKTLWVTELSARYHRIVINNKKYFICSVRMN